MSLLSGSHNSSIDSDLDSSHGAANSSPSPTPEKVSAALDEYVCAAKIGRASLACRDLQTTVEQFNRALDIELQTEMDCLYDTSIGFVNGLVRREVDSRLHGSTSSRGAPSCDKVLEELSKVYREAEICAELKPGEARWYLRMGAALCVANEWEKARLIYKEGLHMCKDKRELHRALKNLTKIELITTGIDCPEEGWKPNQYSPLLKPEEPPKKHRPKSMSFSTSVIRRASQRASQRASRSSRPQSESIDSEQLPYVPPHAPRSRFGSVNLPSRVKNRDRSLSDPPSPAGIRRKKKLRRRPLSGVFSSRNAPIPIIDYEERQLWAEAFKPESEKLSESQDYCRPSAVVHMRRLSVETLPVSSSIMSPECDALNFGAVKLKSLKIESDDSELED